MRHEAEGQGGRNNYSKHIKKRDRTVHRASAGRYGKRDDPSIKSDKNNINSTGNRQERK